MWRRNAVMYVTVPYNKDLFYILYFFNQPIGSCFWNCPRINEYSSNVFQATRGRNEQDYIELLAALVLRVRFWIFNVIIFGTTYMFSSGRTVALRSTQPLTETSTRNIS
jgi:hypothetical protein